MNKCSPAEMRKNLEVVKAYKQHGVDFVAIPAKNEGHKNELIQQANSILADLETITKAD
jgi:hypothetical protein